MIIVLSKKATQQNKDEIIRKLKKLGYRVDVSQGEERTLLGAIGPNMEGKKMIMEQLSTLSYVENVVPILKPYKLVSSELRKHSVVDVSGVAVGGRKLVLMAGPCAVEGPKQILETARALKKLGVPILRAGAYKPRTSPYSFQGFGARGLEMLAAASEETGMRIITEVMEARDVKLVAQFSDILQIGTRNMQNFQLLKACGRSGKPTLLKRGLSATIEEWLLAAEYIMKEGNPNVMLCERGIRTFETHTRNTLDLSAVAAAKGLSHLPVISDPSHGTGRAELVGPMCKASIAAGADGLLVEVHTNPAEAISDGQQTLSIDRFGALMKELGPVAKAMGRTI
jgi:3-deoxy-7-phosphoheptulonate synthase